MSKFWVKNDYIQVPVSFVEDYMKEANGAYVKVYLYILNIASKGQDRSYSEIAKELNLIESDIVNAVEYWKNAGIFKENGE